MIERDHGCCGDASDVVVHGESGEQHLRYCAWQHGGGDDVARICVVRADAAPHDACDENGVLSQEDATVRELEHLLQVPHREIPRSQKPSHSKHCWSGISARVDMNGIHLEHQTWSPKRRCVVRQLSGAVSPTQRAIMAQRT